MALDTDITIPELPTSTSESNNDLILLTQPNAQAETGYSSAKATTETVAKKVVHGIEYETLLADFPQGKRNPTDALNDLRDMVIGQYPIKSFSPTPIATLPDSANGLPMKSLSVNIVPKETGTGTKSPSNPYTISGTDTVTITKCGKNVANGTFVQGSISSTDGTISSSTIRCASDFIKVSAGKTYVGSIASGQKIVRFNQYDKNQNFISGNITPPSFTVASGTVYIRAVVGYSNDGNITPSDVSNFQVEEGSTATTYVPYSATTYTIALGQTVYGGYVDWKNGKLVVTYGIVDLGSLTWGTRAYGSNTGFVAYNQIGGVPLTGTAGKANALCSIYPIVKTGELTVAGADLIMAVGAYFASGCNIYVLDSRFTNAGDFKTAMSGVQLAYELETPIELTGLTPTAIKTTGYDNVSADCGDVEGEYRADIQKYIDEQIASVQALVL